MTNDSPKPHFLSLDFNSLKELVLRLGEKAFRATQVIDWIFKKGVLSPFEMSNISRSLQEALADQVDWTLPAIEDQLPSEDGATKLLLRTAKGQLIESVILRYEDRTSLCVSSQVGCKLACSFCQTGKLGFFSHLSASEILAQFAIARKIVATEGRRLSHVVFMGMGEPLDNYEHVVAAVNTLLDPEVGFGLSNRHVTISTSGIVPKIHGLADDTKAALAISLHAANDELRSELMPINRKYPLSELKNSLQTWQTKTSRKVTIEYILIHNKNASESHARDLVKFLAGLKAKVNLIPFNAHPGLPFERPSAQEIDRFQKYLTSRSIPAPVRYSKGLEVSAACGQLAAKRIVDLNAAPSRKSVVN